MQLVIIDMLLLFLALAALVSTTHGYNPCGKTEFWWSGKDICLPIGGVSGEQHTPSGVQCPDDFYWSNATRCCVPKFEISSEHPSPRCPKGWVWWSILNKCLLHPSFSKAHGHLPKPSAPSAPQPPQPTSHLHPARRQQPARVSLCPSGLSACPIARKGTPSGDYECLNTLLELTSCGGCTMFGKGQDCGAIEGAKHVACEKGFCKVYTCRDGFQLAGDTRSCQRI
ncbi:protein priA [Coprinopsis sp. MPI-PUGE-AT-0042]|nr:protein priA [Coprinopsis sp. MPI-PUGE-AT-0042]